MHENKNIISLSPFKIQDQIQIIELYKEYDIIIDCFRPGVLDSLNLGY